MEANKRIRAQLPTSGSYADTVAPLDTLTHCFLNISFLVAFPLSFRSPNYCISFAYFSPPYFIFLFSYFPLLNRSNNIYRKNRLRTYPLRHNILKCNNRFLLVPKVVPSNPISNMFFSRRVADQVTQPFQ